MARLIAIEGIDGSGKGTQAARLARCLNQRGISTGMLQFPRYSATHFGQAIGEFLNGRFGDLNQVHPQLAAVLYAGDRFESRDVLTALLARHDVVILDRFVGSNLAHQAAKLDGDARRTLIAWIETIEYEVFQLPRPDLTVLIDLSTQWSQELVSRKSARDYTSLSADLHEADLPYLEKVRQCYLEIAQTRADWTVVCGLDDSGTLRGIDDIGNDILQRIDAVATRPPIKNLDNSQ